MNIEKEIKIIKKRNKRVEIDKDWELSWTRRLFIALVTYVVTVIWFILTSERIPLLEALIPAGGYIFSTLSLPFIKRWWFNNFWKKRKIESEI